MHKVSWSRIPVRVYSNQLSRHLLYDLHYYAQTTKITTSRKTKDKRAWGQSGMNMFLSEGMRKVGMYVTFWWSVDWEHRRVLLRG